MAKRFTDTQKYHKPFIRGLQGAYKVLWDYLYHDCDHAGIWIVDFEIAQIYIGKDMPVNKSDALKFFNSGEKRIVEINKGTKWFIPSFIEFQYGELNPENRAHKSVINILKKYNLYSDSKGLISSLQGAKDKDKDKDKEMDKDKDKEKKFVSDLENSEDMFEKITFAIWQLFDKNMERFGVKSTDLSKAKADKWIGDIRKMFEIDKRTKEDFIAIFNFLRDEQPNNSGFAWAMNVRSTDNLRKNFEKILIKAKNHKPQNQEYNRQEIYDLLNQK